MCLIKKSLFPRFTLRDKIVYKVVYVDFILETVYRTPYQYQVITLDKEYKGEWFYSNWIKSLFNFKISDGYIHSIKDLKTVKQFIKNNQFYRPICIFKAVIPKHTLYWEGVDNDIASRRIKYIDKICKIHGNREEIYPCGMT